MTVAIVTKFLGPTNNRGARVKAILPSGKSKTIPFAYELNSDGAHSMAAMVAAREIFNDDRWIAKEIYSIATHPSGYVVIVEKKSN